MNQNQYMKQMPSLSPLLLAICVIIGVVFVVAFGLWFAAETPPRSSQPPAVEGVVQPFFDSLEADEMAGSNALKSVVEESRADEKANGSAAAHSLLAQQAQAGNEKPPCSQEPCEEDYLELVPPQPAGIAEGQTLLLLGVDSRSGGLISLTDTIMLLFLDEEAQRISLLSIPRDLYVEIPGHGRDRINTAVVHGAGGEKDLEAGIATLEKVLERTLDIEIDHHILVDFRAVVRSIDALGGIDVYVPYTIDDPTYPDMSGGFDPLFIPQGQHHFTGEMALKYARTRHQDNDFYRAQRQHQILFAIREQVFNLGVADLLESAPALYQQVRHGVFTDLNILQLVQLGQALSEVPADNIQTAVLDDQYLSSTWTERGEFVLVLKPSVPSSLIEEIFTN